MRPSAKSWRLATIASRSSITRSGSEMKLVPFDTPVASTLTVVALLSPAKLSTTSCTLSATLARLSSTVPARRFLHLWTLPLSLAGRLSPSLSSLVAIDGDLLKLVHLVQRLPHDPWCRPLSRRVTCLIPPPRSTLSSTKNLARWSRSVAPSLAMASQSWKSPASSCTVERTPTLKTPSKGRTEKPMQVHLATTKDVAVLQSKEWFHIDDPRSICSDRP